MPSEITNHITVIIMMLLNKRQKTVDQHISEQHFSATYKTVQERVKRHNKETQEFKSMASMQSQRIHSSIPKEDPHYSEKGVLTLWLIELFFHT